MKTAFAYTVLFVFVAAVLSGPSAFAAPRKNYTDKPDAGAYRDTLKKMPWYDVKQNEYRRFRPDEVPSLKKQKPRTSAPKKPSAVFSKTILYVAGGFFTLILLYVLWNLKKAGPPQGSLKISKNKVGFLHEALDMNDPSDLNSAKTKILAEKALREGRLQDAAVFMFLHVLFSLEEGNNLELKSWKTARDYLRETKRNRKASESFQTAFQTLTHEFEIALYRKSNPREDALRNSWATLQNEGFRF